MFYFAYNHNNDNIRTETNPLSKDTNKQDW